MDSVTVTADGRTVDLILWRRDGRRGQYLLEETYALNPGLAALGPILPVGTRVTLPDPVRMPAGAPAAEPISLFD